MSRAVLPRPVRVKTPKPDRRPSDEDVAHVFRRDGACVLRKLVPSHVCAGRPTIEHVKDDLRMGQRAPSDRRHMVSACLSGNAFTVETSKYRYLIREYLRMVEP